MANETMDRVFKNVFSISGLHLSVCRADALLEFEEENTFDQCHIIPV